MFLKTLEIAPGRVQKILRAAEDAARAIPPAFPLSATVAANPFLGQAGEPTVTASARLERTAGVRLFPSRTAVAAMISRGDILRSDLAAALEAAASPHKPPSPEALTRLLVEDRPSAQPLPTVADLAARTAGADWPALIARTFGAFAAGHFDRGQALWSPAPGCSAFMAWREWAGRDLTPEIAGLSGFCRHVTQAPDTPERAILRAAERLSLSEAAALTVFHRLFMDLGGWAQHARWLLWEAERAGRADETMMDLLAIRLIWEEALLEAHPAVWQLWADTLACHEKPVMASPDDALDAILLSAAERAYQRRLGACLTGPHESREGPAIQAVFCIDVRSEVFRRALEAVDAGIETIGFAGFFGLPLAHRRHGTDETADHLPVLLTPVMTVTGHAEPPAEAAARIRARAQRAWGRFRQAAVSSFAFVESAGPAYLWKLLRDALAGGGHRSAEPAAAPRIESPIDAEQVALACAAALRAMGLARHHAPLVLLIGHGTSLCNNPHESAYQCGACGGQTGEVSARTLARLLNAPENRAALARLGIEIADTTLFLAGLHDTTTDTVTIFRDGSSAPDETIIRRAQQALAEAGVRARAERAARLPGARPAAMRARARNWAEIRPEWGLAGCAAFIAAPRSATRGRDLGGRAFLHSYDWRSDPDFSVLELILTAPVVVASWISLQYYGSTVAPDIFGAGDKLIHNPVGGIGVLQGNGGRLSAGLPWQAVHDGHGLVHEPLRLSVLIEAPEEAIEAILGRNAAVRDLFDNEWLHLLVLEQGRISARYRPHLGFEGLSRTGEAA
jgi:hypothetical protein